MSSFVAKIMALPKFYSIGGAIAILLLVLAGVRVFSHTAPATSPDAGTPHVHVASVAALSSSVGPLPLTGKVTSVSEATILSQTSGEIVSLPHSIGDYVPAGGLIAVFENSAQQAAVLQAQGAYDAAVAALEKATGSQSGQNASATALAALASAYGSLDDAVHTRADQLFSNPRTSPELNFVVPDSTLVNTLRSERIALEASLSAAQALSTSGSTSLDQPLTDMAGYAQQTQTFLDNLIRAVNAASASQSAPAATLAAWQTSLATARSEAAGAVTSVNAAKAAYDAAVGGDSTPNDVKAAQASVTQAQGALSAAKANLEKTYVRSSISGTIVSLSITRGDFVPSFSQVAVVSNPHALYVDAQVTPEDAKSIAVGNKAVISDSIPGVVTFIAPALDPLTGKIEVKVGISSAEAALTDGDIVTLSIDRAGTAKPEDVTRIVIPIVAANITPAGPVVFSVSPDGTLAAHPIVFGSILGDQVVVASGITPDLEIVTDARGLSPGDKVIVDAP